MAREVKKNYIDEGLVRFIFVDFPVHGEPAVIAAEASRCVGEQGDYWAYHERLFGVSLKSGFNRDVAVNLAGEMGLDTEAIGQCLDEQRYRSIVAQQWQLGRDLEVQGTPTFFINSQRIPGFVPFETMKEIIDEELANVQSAP